MNADRKVINHPRNEFLFLLLSLSVFPCPGLHFRLLPFPFIYLSSPRMIDNLKFSRSNVFKQLTQHLPCHLSQSVTEMSGWSIIRQTYNILFFPTRILFKVFFFLQISFSFFYTPPGRSCFFFFFWFASLSDCLNLFTRLEPGSSIVIDIVNPRLLFPRVFRINQTLRGSSFTVWWHFCHFHPR